MNSNETRARRPSSHDPSTPAAIGAEGKARRTRAWAAVVCGLAVGGIVAAAVVAQPAGAGKPPGRAMVGELQSDLDAMVDGGAPGAMLYVRDGRHVTHLTSGFGDLETQTPLRPDDHFKIASLTKTYTATVVLQLVDEDRLVLDDDVEHWLPGLVPNGEEVTVRHLLQHTSGLADYEGDERYLAPYLSGDLGWAWTPRQLVDMAVSQQPNFPPGQTKTSSYSNTNYVLLGMIVEAVSGRTIGEALEGRIFDPLRLDETTYPTEPGLPEPYAHGYMVLGGPPAIDVTGLSPTLSPASGAIVSTAEDVADFYRALLRGRLLDRSLLRQMKHTISEGDHVDIPGQRYGLGIETFPTSCGMGWGHNGVVPGYLTFVYSSEDGKRQALLTVNHDSTTLPQEAADRFFPLIDKAFCSTSAKA